MGFTAPHFLWFLALLPLLAVVKWVADARGKRSVDAAVAPKLRQSLNSPRSRWREWTALGLEMAALAAFIFALARPQAGFKEEEINSSGRSLMLAVDTSRSMLAEDIKPNRLDRTKLVAAELIRQLPGDRIGLIAFAGKAFVQAPVTQDHAALHETLEQFDTELIPRGGSNLGEAIDLAVEAFTGWLPDGTQNPELAKKLGQLKNSSHALVVFSDGEELEGEAMAAAERAKNRGVMIISIGVGTAEGGVIPMETVGYDQFNQPIQGRPDWVRDDEGKIVRSKLNESNLVAVANATRGLYIPLLNVVKDDRLPVILNKLSASENQSRTIRIPLERYQIPLTCGLLLLLAGTAVRTLPRFFHLLPSKQAT